MARMGRRATWLNNQLTGRTNAHQNEKKIHREKGMSLKELMKLDDYERFEVIEEVGECLFAHYWTSDWPGYGSDVSCVYEYKNVYFSTCDSVAYGPHKTYEEALESGGMFQVNSTTRELCSSEFRTEEIAARCECDEAGLKILINDEECISNKKGKLELVEYEGDAENSKRN